MPAFAERDINSILAESSPIKRDVGDILLHQEDYHKKAVVVEGKVTSVVIVDETEEETVQRPWDFPKTIELKASTTWFYITSNSEETVLVKYPADVDVCVDDNVVATGIFNAKTVSIETQGLLHTKKEQVTNELGEPFITAIIIENKTRQKTEYISRTQ